MKLSRILARLSPLSVSGAADVEVSSLVHDSRAAGAGSLFVALAGAKTDGNRFIKDAVERGAAAVISELDAPPPPMALVRSGGGSVAWVRVADAALALASAAAEFYERPSEKLTIVGVTGTNGKTTTTYLLESIFARAGKRCGVIGTVNYRLSGRELEKAPNTTPVSGDLQRLLRRMVDGGATHVAMEVSSHALALKRVEEIDFDAAVFTNLHRDHLDFHKTREAYFDAKASLFTALNRAASTKRKRVAVLNLDDETFPRLRRSAEGAELVTFGFTGDAQLHADSIVPGLTDTKFRLVWGESRRLVRLRLLGRHNVQNALAAAGAALGLGLTLDAVQAGLEGLASVPGRLEAVETGLPFQVLVDFAHTDSALAAVLDQIRLLPHKRVITVFGCGGDRDRTKRGPMGAAAAERSDLVILTNDNPRSEDPEAILAEIEEGVKKSGRQNYKIVPDRKEAVQEAVRVAQEGDVVLIAGKGHETGQILRDRTVPFDDREAAREALRSIRRR